MLAPKPVFIVGHGFGQDFYGNRAVKTRVARAVHLTHAAGAGETLNVVWPELGSHIDRHRDGL